MEGVIRGRWVRAPDGLRGFGGGPGDFGPQNTLEGLKNVEIIANSHIM